MTPRGQSIERAGAKAKLLPPLGTAPSMKAPIPVLLQAPASSQTDRDWRPRRAPGGSQLTQEETGIIWVQIRESPTNLGEVSESVSVTNLGFSIRFYSIYVYIYIYSLEEHCRDEKWRTVNGSFSHPPPPSRDC